MIGYSLILLFLWCGAKMIVVFWLIFGVLILDLFGLAWGMLNLLYILCAYTIFPLPCGTLPYYTSALPLL